MVRREKRLAKSIGKYRTAVSEPGHNSYSIPSKGFNVGEHFPLQGGSGSDHPP